MSKLSEIINEALVQLNVEKYLTNEELKISDPAKITELVNSPKKEDRLTIAVNPNLTLEHQTKLSGDKVVQVKQLLCCNINLDVELARKLLREEIERISLISEYGGAPLNAVVLEFLKKIEKSKVDTILNNLLNSPSPTDDTVEAVINNDPSTLMYVGNRKIYLKKWSKKSVHLMLDALKKVSNHGDSTLARLIINQPEHITEDDIKNLDWKNSSDVQEGISGRTDISEKFTMDMLNTLSSSTRLQYKNPYIVSVDGLNRIMQQYITFKLSFNQNMNLFEDTENLPLDPKLMVSMVKHLKKFNYILNPQNILQNNFFPAYGIDEIGVDDENLKHIISSPGADKKKIEAIIEQYVTEPTNAEKVIWGMAARKDNIDLDIKSSERILKIVDSKANWFKYMASGKVVDNILGGIEDYVTYFTDFGYKTTTPKDSILSCLAQNTKLTITQRKKLLVAHDALKFNEKLPFTANIRTVMALSLDSPDPKFFETLMSTGGNIWAVWTNVTGMKYYQYHESVLPSIDKMALSTTSVPARVMDEFKTFDKWFIRTNFDYDKMSKETGEKYLIHFIKYGDDNLQVKILSDEFLTNNWNTHAVLGALYEKTKDIKYLSDDAKDIFFLLD